MAASPIMPSVRRGGGSAARVSLLAIVEGNCTTSHARSCQVSAEVATAAAAAAAAAFAATIDDAATTQGGVGVGSGGAPAEGRCNDHLCLPALLPAPAAALAKTSHLGERLPPIHVLFPVDGAASAGRTKRARLAVEAGSGGEATQRAAGPARLEDLVANERASKRRAQSPEGGSTGGRGGGDDDRRRSSGRKKTPTKAFLSVATNGGGSPRAALPVVVGSAAESRTTPGVRGLPERSPAAAALTGANTSAVTQRTSYWATVMGETSAQQAERGPFDNGACTTEPPASTSEGSDGDSETSGSSLEGATGLVGATTPAVDRRRAASKAGIDRLSGGANGDNRGSVGCSSSDGSDAGSGPDGGAGDTVANGRSFDLKARILARSRSGSEDKDLRRCPPVPLFATSGGDGLDGGPLPALRPNGMAPQLGGARCATLSAGRHGRPRVRRQWRERRRRGRSGKGASDARGARGRRRSRRLEC